MLTIYRSNRAEWLAKVLSEQLRLSPPELFETIQVIVNTWPTSRWLSEEIANANSISALISFPFPGTYFRNLVQLFLGIEIGSNNAWRGRQLVWHIIELLPELLEREEAIHLNNWLKSHSSETQNLDKNKWQLAMHIAKTFDDYDLYRPELIFKWWQNTEDILNQETDLHPGLHSV